MTVRRRIRQFKTRETYPEQDLDNDLCQSVVAGDAVSTCAARSVRT